MTKLNLEIDRTDGESIKSSFDRIAKDIFRSAIKVNNHELRVTEIEFYFWSDEHQDYSTHDHNRDAGEWRMHNQGIDITFQAEGDSKCGQVGGILIRGIYDDSIVEDRKISQYINGPRLVMFRIFQLMGKVEAQNTLQLVPGRFQTLPPIYTAQRHGLKEAKTDTYEISKELYMDKANRYFTDKGKLSYPASHWGKLKISELV
ncbi:hypothetical protein BH09BAC1_BH09BAC1_17700 [soil metagenome]